MAGKLFKEKSVEEQTTSLASFMPGGRPFLAARLPSTTLRKLLYGLGEELYRVDSVINDITFEHQTTLLIDQWESALGIPDECFPGTGDLATRRTHVLAKLAALGIQTAQDFVDLATLFGYTIEIIPGANRGLFPFSAGFPVYFFDYKATARFTMFIRMTTLTFPNVFTYTFPLLFEDRSFSIIECLLEHLRPANTDIVWEYTLPDVYGITTEPETAYLGSEDGDIILTELAP
jgi:uncharacterized protein YmfQ (DUF2313 family)